MVEGFNATQRELEILELRKEVSALKTNVEYWRLAAERRDARKELTGLDVPEARTLDAPEPPQCEVQTSDAVKLTYIKRWRTIVPLPAKYADEIAEALRASAQALEVTPAMLDAGAQALANDVWHPPQPLASLSNSDVMKYRRQALLVLKASLSLPSADREASNG